MSLDTQFNKQFRDIKKTKRSLFNRLNSIYYDSKFVDYIISNYPEFAIIANLRCGSWYINPRKRNVNECYFKSTDGHFGKWDFSLIRTNFHLLNLIKDYKGLMIFDSTQKGKQFSDAQSKTIPIWCCILNRSIQKYFMDRDIDHPSKDWDLRFHSVPSIISKEEANYIELKLSELIEKVMRIDLSSIASLITKPLRPIWISPQTTFLEDYIPTFQSDKFYPILCVSTSELIDKKISNSISSNFDYVQGAGDDEETWSLGLTHKLFWHHLDLILNKEEFELDEFVKDLVINSNPEDFESLDSELNTQFDFIGNTNVAIGSRQSGKPPNCWTNFDIIVNCCNLEYTEMATSLPSEELSKRYLFLNIPEGKKGQHVFFESISKMLEFVTEPLSLGKKVLFHCAQGVDRSVGMALIVISNYLTKEMNLNLTKLNTNLNKTSINNNLNYIMRYRIKANPSGHTLRRINEYLINY